jgi:hypothetical protein
MSAQELGMHGGSGLAPSRGEYQMETGNDKRKGVLLVMLAACSPPTHAQVFTPYANAAVVRNRDVVRMELITVTPLLDDMPAPAKSRWQRFDEALNTGPSRKYRVVEWAANNGVRTACYEPCSQNCCVSSGEFSLTGRGLGR